MPGLPRPVVATRSAAWLSRSKIEGYLPVIRDGKYLLLIFTMTT